MQSASSSMLHTCTRGPRRDWLRARSSATALTPTQQLSDGHQIKHLSYFDLIGINWRYSFLNISMGVQQSSNGGLDLFCFFFPIWWEQRGQECVGCFSRSPLLHMSEPRHRCPCDLRNRIKGGGRVFALHQASAFARGTRLNNPATIPAEAAAAPPLAVKR